MLVKTNHKASASGIEPYARACQQPLTVRMRSLSPVLLATLSDGLARGSKASSQSYFSINQIINQDDVSVGSYCFSIISANQYGIPILVRTCATIDSSMSHHLSVRHFALGRLVPKKVCRSLLKSRMFCMSVRRVESPCARRLHAGRSSRHY